MLIVDVEEKRFGERILLKDTYFKVYNEDKILVSGPNGSGKTTLLNIIAGIDRAAKWRLADRHSRLARVSPLDGG